MSPKGQMMTKARPTTSSAGTDLNRRESSEAPRLSPMTQMWSSGMTSGGSPTGIQIVARPYDDVTAFRIAKALEQRQRPQQE